MRRSERRSWGRPSRRAGCSRTGAAAGTRDRDTAGHRVQGVAGGDRAAPHVDDVVTDHYVRSRDGGDQFQAAAAGELRDRVVRANSGRRGAGRPQRHHALHDAVTTGKCCTTRRPTEAHAPAAKPLGREARHCGVTTRRLAALRHKDGPPRVQTPRRAVPPVCLAAVLLSRTARGLAAALATGPGPYLGVWTGPVHHLGVWTGPAHHGCRLPPGSRRRRNKRSQPGHPR